MGKLAQHKAGGDKDQGEATEESGDTSEEFDWFEGEKMSEDTYFTFVNKNRKDYHPGDQVFYCYGNRSNKFLLINYGFVFPGNRYDSYEVPLRMDVSSSLL